MSNTTYRFSLLNDWHPVNYQNEETGQYVTNHNKIEAIKAVRSVTGRGLKESKGVIDALYRDGRPNMTLDVAIDYEVTDSELQTAYANLESNGIQVEKGMDIEAIPAGEAIAKLLDMIAEQEVSTKDAVAEAAKIALANGDYGIANELTGILAHQL